MAPDRIATIEHFHRPRRPHPRGLTLLELMVVISILGLMLFFVVPNMDKILPSARINGATRAIAATIGFARSQAIFTGKPYEVHFQIDESWYQMLSYDQVEAGPYGGGLRPRKAYLPGKVRIRDIQFATGTKKESGLVKVRISPLGRFDEFVIHLVDRRRRQDNPVPWTVHFDPLTGLSDIYDYEKTVGQISERDLFQP